VKRKAAATSAQRTPAKRAEPKRTPAKRAAKPTKRRPAKAPRAASKRRALAPTATSLVIDQPLGVGVADAFALERLRGPPTPRDDSSGVREIGWAEFGDLARDLADRIAAEDWAPDVVLAIANAGVFVGGAIAPVFGAELVHLHLPGRGRAERLPRLAGKRVLVVDDAANSGKTLDIAVKAARSAHASEVRSAVIALRPGGARPDWTAMETRDIVVFGWDYQFDVSDGDPGDTGV
jgi:hypothetical protein